MRHAPISIAAATAIFVLGVFIINIQVWYSARADSLAGAHYVVRNMHVILTEAHHATQVAMRLAENECDAEGQYRLGTEAALQPHLRTIVILKKDAVWCSSLPGNRVLLVNGSALPEAPLLLVPSKSTVNGLPVLLYQTNHAGSRIMVSISDSHIRDALNMPLRGVAYSLLVGNRRLGQSGDVLTAAHSNNDVLTLKDVDYAFAIQFNAPPLFSLTRLFDQAGGVVLFLLLVSSLSAYLLQRYLSKDISPEESLRTAIYRNEIIPYYQPVVSGKEGTLRGVEVLARWKHPQSGFISPSSFIPLAEKTGLIIPLTQSLMRQVATQMNAIFGDAANLLI
ncbi:CSS-motif domain-containing protein [Enterobacter roggenkampii]|uniref:CSS-motif domain-containing protein n=1 Tax=Enterobacter roggenkampii TaxID=1812935 RepID=UPI002003B844|nr:EAL domain-containing protein [Enterobacter roggenkampii]MCK7202380.1 EAL domain-containing protein [Enterobacter roggenkampii]